MERKFAEKVLCGTMRMCCGSASYNEILCVTSAMDISHACFFSSAPRASRSTNGSGSVHTFSAGDPVHSEVGGSTSWLSTSVSGVSIGALADDGAGLHGDERAGDDGAPADDDAAVRLPLLSLGGRGRLVREDDAAAHDGAVADRERVERRGRRASTYASVPTWPPAARHHHSVVKCDSSRR